ncbi:MAG: hypothetical protein MJ093_03255 [Saccharofermentans sp.]|nr:hypothetical protein [Saccharofermentans sp.]
MKICVLSCSPKGETSLTLQTINFLKKYYPDDEFIVHLTTKVTCEESVIDCACESDLIMILSSIFHLNVHSQMMSMLDQLAAGMKAKLGDDINKKFFTYITSSNFLYDVGAHKYVSRWIEGEKLNGLRFLSLKDDSMLTETGREEVYRWFQYTKETIDIRRTGNVPQVTEKRRVAIINAGLAASTVDKVANLYKARGCDVECFNLDEYKIAPCTACFACYSNRICCMKDDFVDLVDKIGTGTDLLVNLGNLKYGMLGQKYKTYIDRHVQFGRAGTGDETINISFVESDEDTEARMKSMYDFTQWEEATVGIGRCYVAGTHYLRIKDQEFDITSQVNDTILIMNNELIGQRNFFSETLNTRFAELANHLQIMCPIDYAHYKKEGYYKPQLMNTNVRYIDDLKGGQMACKMRLMPYNMTLNGEGTTPKLTKRRKYRDMSYVEHLRKGDGDEGKAEKGGFLGLFGKKK